MQKKDYKRREFLTKSIPGLAAFGLNVFPKRLSPLQQTNQDHEIIYRTLGKTGLKIPIISMGLLNTKDPGLIKNSYDAGIRLFSTAMEYGKGKNEEMLGAAIKKHDIRKNVIILTKVLHPNGIGFGRTEEKLNEKQIRDKFLENFQGCLKRLKTDYVDILLYHSVDNTARLNDPGVRDAIKLLKKDGKIKFSGVSTHSKVVKEAADSSFFDVIMTQFNFTMDDDKRYINDINYAAEKGVGIIAMKTQGGNRLAKGNMNHKALLKWVLRHETITTAVPAYTNIKQLEEDFSVAHNLDFTDEDTKFLKDKKIRYGFHFCRQCEKCLSTCPKSTDIPTLMRAYMYAYGYNNPSLCGDTITAIPKNKGISNCLSCNMCSANCTNNIAIAENIDELKNMYLIFRNKISL